MTTHVQKVPLWQLILTLTHKVLNRLRFFPMTLVFMVLNAFLKWLELRCDLARTAVGDATRVRENASAGIMTWLTRVLAGAQVGDATRVRENTSAGIMTWLARVLADAQGRRLDACVCLPREGGSPNVHDIVSTLLVFPHFRSLALYWDEGSLADDLSIWQRTPGEPAAPISPAPDARQLADLARAGVDALGLPVGVAREMETMLKREAGGAQVVCLNLPAGMDSLREAIVAARPEAHFYDFSDVPLSPAPSRYACTVRHGLTVHERFALVASADAYVGRLDELGCVAAMSRRRTVILSEDPLDGAMADLAGTVAWLSVRRDAKVLASEVLARMEKAALAP